MRKELILPVVAIIMISLATAEMPASFYQAMGNMKNEDVLCVKNYDAGASVTEAYKDFEYLEKDTQVVSRSYKSDEKEKRKGNATLEVSINSNVIGKAHIAWQSRDATPNRMGRHALYSRAADDMTGVFSIEKLIQLWSNGTLGEVSLEWLPCG